MKNRTILLFVAVFVFSIFKATDAEIYYRQYDGTIPADALVVGNDGNDYYVGLGVTHGVNKVKDTYGLFPGRLQAGSTEMQVSIGGAAHITDGLMILCGTPGTSLSWIAVTGTQFYDDLGDNKPAYGGREGSNTRDYATRLYIGRVDNNVGKVCLDYIALYVLDSKGNEQQYTSFEVLVVNDN